MKKRVRAAVGALATTALVVGTVGPAHAGTATGSTEGWIAAVDIPDVTWNLTSGCEQIPVDINTEGWGADSWGVDMDIRHVQSGSSSSWFFDYGYTYGSETVDDYSWTGDFQLCPFDTPPGTYVAEGSFEYGYESDYDYYGAPGVQKVALSTTFTVSRMSSTTELNPIVSNGDEARISGRVIANSPKFGNVGASSEAVSIDQYVNGGWLHIATLYTDHLGYFTSIFTGVSAPNSIRAVFNGTAKVDSSASPGITPQLPSPPAPPVVDPAPPAPPAPPVVDPAPSASVKVKAVSGKSKLRVDVNPNKGSGYWKFQVQKQRASGSWKSLKTYRTKGSKEIRTIDLKKGTYRVVVKPKYGYAGTTSASVYLKK